MFKVLGRMFGVLRLWFYSKTGVALVLLGALQALVSGPVGKERCMGSLYIYMYIYIYADSSGGNVITVARLYSIVVKAQREAP